MILGLGTDLVEISRIESAMARFDPRFIERLLTPPEIAYCRAQGRPAAAVAARFAAKEAVSKAFGTGIGAELGWHDIEISRLATGQPLVRLHGKAVTLLRARGADAIHLSISHTNDHATAVAILERRTGGEVSPARLG